MLRLISAGSASTAHATFYIQQAPSFNISDGPVSSKIILTERRRTFARTPIILLGSNSTVCSWYYIGTVYEMKLQGDVKELRHFIETDSLKDAIPVICRNNFGSATYTFLLEWIMEPKWVTELDPITYVEFGNDLTLVVRVFHNGKCTVEWEHFGRWIRENSRRKMRSEFFGDVGVYYLTLYNVTSSDREPYTARVRQCLKEITSTTEVIVKPSKSNRKANDHKQELFRN